MPETSSSAQIDPTPYLEYLDREMRLFGILSTFCVAVAALIIDRVMNAVPDSYLEKLWSNEQISLLISLCAILYAAGEFFRQRRHYSFRYGQITLVWVRARARPLWHCNESAVLKELRNAESWKSQRRYKRGRLALILAFAQLGIAVWAERSGWWWPYLVYVPLGVSLVYCLFEYKALGQDLSVEHPVRTLFKKVCTCLKNKLLWK